MPINTDEKVTAPTDKSGGLLRIRTDARQPSCKYVASSIDIAVNFDTYTSCAQVYYSTLWAKTQVANGHPCNALKHPRSPYIPPLKRLGVTGSPLNDIKLIIFDADGTLRQTMVKNQPCPNRDGEWALMPGVKARLSAFDWGSPADGKMGYGIVSNQGGVALGYLTGEMARSLLYKLFVKAFGFNPYPGEVLACTHAPNEGCPCRKPEPGLLLALMRMWRVSPAQTLMVGDRESDHQAARNAGCNFMWAKDFFGGNQNG